MESLVAAHAIREFAVPLHKRLATRPGNLVWSPFSVAAVLAMLRPGARGQTADEIDAVLHSPGPTDLNPSFSALIELIASRSGLRNLTQGYPPSSPVEVALATPNSLWGQVSTPWLPAFTSELDDRFGAAWRSVDFCLAPDRVAATINRWTSDQTHGRIPDILPPDIIGGDTRLVLVSAIYLKAPWREPFRLEDTRAATFTRADGASVEVPTMSGALHVAQVGHGDGWRTARLPYADGALAMTIVLPDGSLDSFVGCLDASILHAILTETRRAPSLKISLPRWTYRQKAKLNGDLSDLGMPTVFAPDQADLSGMTTAQRLFVKAVLHNAFIAVDEAGTEAAAATAAVLVSLSAGEHTFVVDRPFFFVIHEVETATPLFMGQVADPLEGV